MTQSRFKVIIIGAGPVGLLAALALRSANIDFIILEQRSDVLVDSGAGLALNPASLRIFHQLGLLDKLLPLGCELCRKTTFTLAGGHLFDSNVFTYMKNNHGCSLYCFHRAELVQFLYDALSDDHDKIFSNKKLTEIITTTTTAQGNNNSVKVTCADGSSYTGSIVLGADGVHSQTRVLMRKLALLQAQRDTDTTAWENELAFPANYNCLFFSIAPTTPSTAGLFVDTESKDRCLFYMAGHQRGWVFLCETASKDDKSNNTTTPLDFASRFADFPITKDTKVKDVFPHASTTTTTSIGMTSLQEGLAGQWSWDRIVLAGDSCRKFTPHAGLGYNSGVQDVVVLVNVLQKTLGSKQQLQVGQEDVTTEQIAEAFRAYQDLRMPFAKADSFVSAAFARLQSWANWAFYIMARYVFPLWIWDYMLYNHVSPAGIKHAAILEHISAEEPFTGRIEWENKMQAK